VTAQAGPAQAHDSAEPTPREDGRVGGPAGGQLVPRPAAHCSRTPSGADLCGAPAEPAVGSWPPSPRSTRGGGGADGPHPARYRLSFSPRVGQTVHALAQAPDSCARHEAQGSAGVSIARTGVCRISNVVFPREILKIVIVVCLSVCLVFYCLGQNLLKFLVVKSPQSYNTERFTEHNDSHLQNLAWNTTIRIFKISRKISQVIFFLRNPSPILAATKSTQESRSETKTCLRAESVRRQEIPNLAGFSSEEITIFVICFRV
jgi:hypothetical protein